MAESKNKPTLTNDSVVLITGGAKGITAQCALRLAERASCKFILVGRSALGIDEPVWANMSSNSEDLQKRAIAYLKERGEKFSPKDLHLMISAVLSSREIKTTLDAIQSYGGQALYISADVTDEKDLAEKVKSAENQLGPVTGFIHGAGNLADKFIENKTEKDYDLVVNTKVKGLQSVMNSIDPKKLDFLILFSSVAGFFGNAGQADYALANEVLNKSAYILHKSLPDCRVIAINWGPWDSGMVSPQLKKYLEKRGIPLINTETGVETLLKEITGKGAPAPQVVVGSSIFGEYEVNINDDRPIVIQRTITLEENPFVKDHEVGLSAVLPATCAASWLINACEASFPGWHFHRVEDFKVLKGVTFGDGLREYEMKLEKAESEKGEKAIEAIVTSKNDKGRRIFHYSSTVVLTRKLPPAPVHHDLPITSIETMDSRKFYEDGTLFHGPTFQGIQKVAFDGNGKVITMVMLPPIPYQIQGQFPAGSVNPYIHDAIVQSLLIWSQENYSAPCLPSRLREWVQYRSAPFGIPVWAILTVVNHSEFAVTGDILVVGEDGREYFHYKGLEGTISRRLNRLIGRKVPSLQVK